MLLAATAVVALAVGACSGPAPVGATSASPPPTRAATYEPPTSAPLDTSIDGQGGGGDTPVDYSSSAQELFYTWVSYEALDAKQLTHSDSEFYAAGLGVCSWIVNGQATAARSVDVLKQNAGYTGTEAAAIVRSALVALCPSYDLGFRTAFDADFAKFVDSMRGRITFLRDIAYEEVGTFMAATCMILGDPSIGGAGVYGAIQNMAAQRYITMVDANDEQTIRVLINLATSAHCNGYYSHLPPVIQGAVRY